MRIGRELYNGGPVSIRRERFRFIGRRRTYRRFMTPGIIWEGRNNTQMVAIVDVRAVHKNQIPQKKDRYL